MQLSLFQGNENSTFHHYLDSDADLFILLYPPPFFVGKTEANSLMNKLTDYIFIRLTSSCIYINILLSSWGEDGGYDYLFLKSQINFFEKNFMNGRMDY